MAKKSSGAGARIVQRLIKTAFGDTNPGHSIW
jgi:hypothetical protein